MKITDDRSVGIIVYRKFPRSVKYLIIKHKKGHWSFPKGHPEKGEKDMQTALRELREEVGITEINFLSKKILVSEVYLYTNKHGERIRKKAEYFIAESATDYVSIDNKEIIIYKWLTAKKAVEKITYPEGRKLFRKADAIVKKALQ